MFDVLASQQWYARRIGESRSLRSLRFVHSDGNAVMPYISFSHRTLITSSWPKCWGWKARQTRSKRGQAADVYVSTVCSSMYIDSTAVSKIGKSKKTQTVWFPPWDKTDWSLCKVFGRRFTQRYGNNQSFPLVGCVVVDWTAIRPREIDPKWFHWMSWRRTVSLGLFYLFGIIKLHAFLVQYVSWNALTYQCDGVLHAFTSFFQEVTCNASVLQS